MAALIIAIVVGLGLLGKEAFQRPQDAYAMQGAGELIIAHLRLHTNQWPRGWHELSETYTELLQTGSTAGIGSTLKQIQRRIDFDWNANAGDLKRSVFTNDIPPFHVIKLKNGRNTHWMGAEPNAMIWQYLQSNQPKGVATNSITE